MATRRLLELLTVTALIRLKAQVRFVLNYGIDIAFKTINPIPTGWGNPSVFYYATDFGNGKMSWYFPEKDGRVQWKKVKK